MVRPDAGRSSEPLRRLFKHAIVRVQQMKSWCSSDALDLYAVSTRKKAAFVEHIVGRPSLARWSLSQGPPSRGAAGCSRELDDGLRRVVVPAAAIGAGGTTSQFAVLVRAAGRRVLPGVYGLNRPLGSACLVVPSPRGAATEGTKVMGLVEMIDLMVTRRIASILLMYQVDFCPAH